MKANLLITDRNRRDRRRYALRRGLGFWDLTFEGQHAVFKHELGALYVACLLLDPPREPIHAVALALKAREIASRAAGSGQAAGPCELVQQRSMGLDDAAAVRALWRRQRALERVLEDADAIEPVKSEALRQLEEITEFLRKSPWRSRGGAERCVRAVTAAIKRLQVHLGSSVDAEGRMHPVLQGFARHLYHHLLVPSGRGGGHGGARAVNGFGGFFTYEPPNGIVSAHKGRAGPREDGLIRGMNGLAWPPIGWPAAQASVRNRGLSERTPLAFYLAGSCSPESAMNLLGSSQTSRERATP